MSSYLKNWLAGFFFLLGIALTSSLGLWQIHRAQERLSRQAHIDAWKNAEPVLITQTPIALNQILDRPVIVRGHFLKSQTVYLDNRPYAEQTGLYVITPLLIEGSNATYVLIKRGWIPRNINDRTQIAAYATPEGEVLIKGIAKANPTRVWALGQPSMDNGHTLRQNLDVHDYAKEYAWKTYQPFVIEQTTQALIESTRHTNSKNFLSQHVDAIGQSRNHDGLDNDGRDHDGLVRDWPQASEGYTRNYGYAVQWFGLSLLLCFFGLRALYKRYISH